MNPLDRIKARQRERRAAEQQAQPAAPSKPAGRAAGTLAQYQAAVDAALTRMAAFPALGPERDAIKRETLDAIEPFVAHYVEHMHAYPNSVAVQAMVWLFDVGKIEKALNLGLYLIRLGNQVPPPKFNRRNLEPVVCQCVYDWANAQLKADASASPYLDELIAAMEQAGRWDLPPVLAGMVYAMAAKHADRIKDYTAVVALCEQAQAANPGGAGVKTLLTSARAKLADGK